MGRGNSESITSFPTGAFCSGNVNVDLGYHCVFEGMITAAGTEADVLSKVKKWLNEKLVMSLQLLL
jgi:hypothetical protein